MYKYFFIFLKNYILIQTLDPEGISELSGLGFCFHKHGTVRILVGVSQSE